MLNNEIRNFYKRFYEKLEHPFDRNVSQQLKIEDLEIALDFLEEVLETEVSEERLQEVESRFNAAFENYINLPRIQIGALCNSIEKLASLLDPFLKKLAFKFYPQEKIKKGKKLIPLWRVSDFADILDVLKIAKVNLKRSDEGSWVRQPWDQAILRVAFVTRHKGVHESHKYSLQELERIAYATIGSYLVICLNVMQDPSIKKLYRQNVERRHFATLLRSKTEAFTTTGSLLSANEHLNIYRHRSAIEPTVEEARFLFICYLASSGPVFFWLKKYNKSLKIKWALEALKMQDELIRRNAFRYLIGNGRRFNLEEIMEFFSEYELKVELAMYILKLARTSDVNLLLLLYRNKAEEVADAAFEMLHRMVRRENSSILQRLAVSQSLNRQYLLQSLIRKIAKRKRLVRYRQFVSIKNNASKMIMLYCLGEVGEKRDIALIQSWLNERRRGKALKYASWYSIGRIASKNRDTNLVLRLLKKHDRDIQIAVYESLTREGIGKHFDYLFRCRNISEESKCNVISQISNREDLDSIKNYLLRIELDNNARELVLTVCRLGGAKEFDFLINLFSNHPSKIEFWNHVKIASGIGRLCNRKRIPYFKKIINSPEFWEYYGQQRSKNKPMPVKNFENIPLMRRIVAAAFCKVANKSETSILRKLLKHYYKWIGLNASMALEHFSDAEELNLLLQESLSSNETDHQGDVISALCLIDKKLYEQ